MHPLTDPHPTGPSGLCRPPPTTARVSRPRGHGDGLGWGRHGPIDMVVRGNGSHADPRPQMEWGTAASAARALRRDSIAN